MCNIQNFYPLKFWHQRKQVLPLSLSTANIINLQSDGRRDLKMRTDGVQFSIVLAFGFYRLDRLNNQKKKLTKR